MTESEFGFNSQTASEQRRAHDESKRMRVVYGDPESGVGYINPYEDDIYTPGGVFPAPQELMEGKGQRDSDTQNQDKQ